MCARKTLVLQTFRQRARCGFSGTKKRRPPGEQFPAPRPETIRGAAPGTGRGLGAAHSEGSPARRGDRARRAPGNPGHPVRSGQGIAALLRSLPVSRFVPDRMRGNPSTCTTIWDAISPLSGAADHPARRLRVGVQGDPERETAGLQDLRRTARREADRRDRDPGRQDSLQALSPAFVEQNAENRRLSRTQPRRKAEQ